MALLKIFGGARGETGAVNSALTKLDRKKTTVRVELENTQIRFNTVIVFRRNTVVLAKPKALEEGLKTGTMVRFHIPGTDHDVRMEIATPHFNLVNGSPVFLCHPPKFFAKKTNRDEDRFSTKQFKNLLLHLHSLPDKFRILDLSNKGIRILTSNPNPKRQFPLAEKFKGAWIQFGKRAKVELEQVIPRSHKGQSVGLELTISDNGNNKKILEQVVKTLDRNQRDLLKAQSL